jgi:basic amino acid/polyamine antiporter, APA family
MVVVAEVAHRTLRVVPLVARSIHSERLSQLRRDIRKWDLVSLVLNLVIGAGIFGLPSRVYALSGVYSLLAYAVCALFVSLILACFAEVSSRFRDTGGLYLYAREAFGELVGFEVGWLAWLVRLTAFAALCNLFVDYLGFFLPAAASGSGRAIVIVLVVAVLATVNISGVRLASVFGNVFTIGKLAPLVLLVVVGVAHVEPGNFAPAAAVNYDALSGSVLLLVFAFGGFESAVIPAGESANPQRDVPYALFIGIAVTAVLYVAIQAVCIGVLPGLASSSRPLADAGSRLLGPSGAVLISAGALISVMGTMNAVMLSAPRLLFAMAERRQLPPQMAATHPRYGTPHAAILLSAGGMLALSLGATFVSAVTLSTVIRLMTYFITCAALPILRRRRGGEPAQFVVPAGELVSALALALIVWLLSTTSWADLRQALLGAAVGLVLYGLYGRATARRSSWPGA